MDGITGASYASLLGLLICTLPTLAGAWYCFSPGERLLALMRPLTLAAIFAALCSFLLALVNGVRAISVMKALDADSVRLVGVIMKEGLAPVALSFALLTVAWALVTVGMRKV